jgi:hypothetical protein
MTNTVFPALKADHLQPLFILPASPPAIFKKV